MPLSGSATAGQIPTPAENTRRGYHDFYAGYHTETETDRVYGGGTGGATGGLDIKFLSVTDDDTATIVLELLKIYTTY